MKKVYIVNKSSHDFTPAESYGDVIFLSEGSVNRYATNTMVRQFEDMMEGSSEDDYIVPCSLNVMNSIACAIFAHKHGKLNLLLFKDGSYIERNHVL
uniref:Uncharacterized protein n=1 Tax=viral metagenome TaxID=1070528 RepID=A0A6M3LTH4_9ZZZZ